MPAFCLPCQCSARFQVLTNRPMTMTGRRTTRGTAASKKAVIPTPQTDILTTTRGSAPVATQTKHCVWGGRPAIIETASLIPPSGHLEEPQAASLPTKPIKKSAANII